MHNLCLSLHLTNGFRFTLQIYIREVLQNVVVDYHRLSFSCCSTAGLWSKVKRSNWVNLDWDSMLCLVLFNSCLESQINIVEILCTCLIVCMCKVLSKVIQGLLRYRGWKLGWKGTRYKGFVKGPFIKVVMFIQLYLPEMNNCYKLYISELYSYYNWNRISNRFGRYGDR